MIDLAGFVDAGKADASIDGFTYKEQAFWSRHPSCCQNLFVAHRGVVQFGRVAVQTHSAVLERTQCLLQAFGECATDGHCLSNALHLCSKNSAGAREFFKCPTRNFRNYVVNGWFKTGRRHLRNVVRNFIQRVSNSKFCRNFCDRESGCLRCQRRRTRHAWVHFNHHEITIFWIHRELHV